MSALQKTTLEPENVQNGEIGNDSQTTNILANGLDFPPEHQWKNSLKHSFRDIIELAEYLQIDTPKHFTPDPHFPLLVTRSFAKRMRKGDLADPLLQQILPTTFEHIETTEVRDAVGDLNAKRLPGVIHKYRGRVLLILAPVCAIHCRYCFRKHYPYQDDPHSLQDWQVVINSIGSDQTIKEVILSGGDPLMLSDRRLSEIITMLEELPQLERVRIHSRLPIVLPDRIQSPLISMLQRTRLSPIMVVHANHPQEIADDCAAALRRLVRSGIPTLNQTVLLRGINDTASVLGELSSKLVNLGVMPYYLHQRDAVAGTSHFEVPIEEGLKLIEELQSLLPGYAVPKYVQEVAGEASKMALN
jgi:EF-P beta-lysylation protein EpmB